MSRLLRAAAAALAVAAYALPLTLGLVADMGHGAHHLIGELQDHRRLAVELGLVHAHEAKASGRSVTTDRGRFVHSHGGAAHSHDAATDALLVAAAQADEDAGDDHTPSSVQLSIHVPAASPHLAAAPTRMLATAAFTAPSVGIHASPPTPPPPRA